MSKRYDITRETPRHLVMLVESDPDLNNIRFLPNFMIIIRELFNATETQFQQLQNEIEFERSAKNSIRLSK